MALQSNLHYESGRTEQIISEFLLKSLHVILESRIPFVRSNNHNVVQIGSGSSSESRVRRREKWFNLALGELPLALENFNLCYRNVLDPMIVDVLLVRGASPVGDRHSVETSPSSRQSVSYWNASDDFRTSSETILERWVVQYESLKTNTRDYASGKVWVGSGQTKFDNAQMNSHSSEGPNAYKKTYKRSIILLRSLYATSRLLPAYRVFRMLNSSNQTYNFNLNYKVSSFCEPFARTDEEGMQQYSFLPVETPAGRLCVSVTYRPVLSDLNLEASLSVPPQIIVDYVGSPAAGPLKIFPSGSSARSVDKGVGATSFPLHKIVSPSSTPLQRPHSWTSGISRATPVRHKFHPFSVSPSAYPTYLDSQTSPFVHRFPPRAPFVDNSPPISPYLHPSYRTSSSTHRKGLSVDEFWLSPPFSPSSSPSPPTHLSGSNPLQVRPHLGSDPVSIPSSTADKGRSYLTPNLSDPNKILLPPPSPKSMKVDPYSQDDNSRAPTNLFPGFQGSPSESKSWRKIEALRTGEYYTGTGNLHSYSGQKVLKDGRDDSGRFSGVGSPRAGFSRSSSRLSFQDDVDDCEFSCPFAVDDVDTVDSHTRTVEGREAQESTQSLLPAGKSQDAAVGILVQMLRTAPPLRRDHSYSSQSSKSEIDREVSMSGSFMSRKTADALEELQGYREMKELLLSQSGTQLLESVRQKTK